MRGLASARERGTPVRMPVLVLKVPERSNLLLPARFDMMGYRLYKTYVDLTNIVVRISDGTPAGKQHAVLVNAHVDSTLPSPGAADDALPVGIMLECMRVLVNTPDWEPSHAVVFCEHLEIVRHMITRH